jgi:hypothetical protein
VGGQCQWRSDGELRSTDGLTRRSGGWINKIGRLTRGAAPVELRSISLGTAQTKSAEDFEDRIPCRKNRLRIIVGCITLCLSAGIYRVQES